VLSLEKWNIMPSLTLHLDVDGGEGVQEEQVVWISESTGEMWQFWR
jgi:hypothetical protein